MQSREAEQRWPDPQGGAVSVELADMLIEELDADFNKEVNRFPGIDPEAGPAFHRLLPHARLAVAQEMLGVLKSEAQLEEEMERRMKNGEKLPPEDSNESRAAPGAFTPGEYLD